MALATLAQTPPVAQRVVAMSGRLAVSPHAWPVGARVHLLHGAADTVVPTQESVDAHAKLAALQADVSLDLIPGLAHGIDARMLACLRARLVP